MTILQRIQSKQSLFTGILTLLVGIWLLFYAIPELFASLFNSLIGNFILLFVVILTSMENVAIALGLAVLFVFLYNFSHYVVKDPPQEST